MSSRNGQWLCTTARFVNYESPEAGIRGRLDFLRRNTRYSAYHTASNAEEAAVALQRAGYATDPNYAAQLIALIRRLRTQNRAWNAVRGADSRLASRGNFIRGGLYSQAASGSWSVRDGIVYHKLGDRQEAYLPWNGAPRSIERIAADATGCWLLSNGSHRRITVGQPNDGDGYGGYVRAELGDDSAHAPIADAYRRMVGLINDWMGTPYSWGNQSKSGTDCSGFVLSAHRAAGVELPRTSGEMAQCNKGKRITGDLHWGDVLCFNGHVALYIGNGQTVESRTHSGVSKVSYLDTDTDYRASLSAECGLIGMSTRLTCHPRSQQRWFSLDSRPIVAYTNPCCMQAKGKNNVSLNSRSRAVTEGLQRAPNRSMLRAVGFEDADFEKPIVGISNAHSTITPCNVGIGALVARAEIALRDAGAMPQTFGTITVSDGISMGTEGMKYSLVSREVIADSIETATMAQSMDGVLTIGGCDKNMPGAMIALARMNIPSVFVYGGTIKPGKYRGKDLTIVSVFEAVGAHAAHKMDEETLHGIECNAISGAGSCGGMYTANTMSSAFEAMGMSLPYSSTMAAEDEEKAVSTEESARVLYDCIVHQRLPRQMSDPEGIRERDCAQHGGRRFDERGAAPSCHRPRRRKSR